MPNPRVESWIENQRKMVGPGAICVARVVLVGPEGDAWGTWAIDSENLVEAIDETIVTQGEERGHGIYHAKLVGLDQSGDQIALLPVRIHGKAPQALGAGNEATALQRATGLAVGSLEQIIATQGNHVEKLGAIIDSLIEDRSILLEEFNKQQSDNLDVELRMKEWMAQQEMKQEVWTFIKEQGLPALLPALSAWTENQEEERQKRKEQSQKRNELQSAPYPPGWPGPTEELPPTAAGIASRLATTAPEKSRGGASSPKRMEAGDTPQPLGDLLSMVRKPSKDQAGVSDAPGEPTPGTRQAAVGPPPGSTTELSHDAGPIDPKPTDGAGGDGVDRPAKPKTDGTASRPRSVRPRTGSRQRKTAKRR